MSEHAIEMCAVSKRFSTLQVLANLNLSVPNKSVFAFLGNNGSGKSTAIRLMVGLSRPDTGSIQVLGRDVAKERESILRDIGCLVDAPSAYPNLTAREFLKIACLIKDLPFTEIERALELVSLQVDHRQLVAHFSLGMKQRLALAHALLGKPRLLILDEPSNGLDPSGIQEIRQLIRELPERAQCTVFLSSHQLDEVEKVASHLALLDRGCIRFQSKLEDIYALSEGALSLELDCTKIAAKLLETHHFKIEIESKTRLKVRHISRENAHQVHACIVNANLRLHLSTFETPSLEHWFHLQTHGAT